MHYLIQVYFFTNYFWCYRNHTLECIDEIFFFLFLFNLVSFFLLAAFDINFPCFRSRFILTERITVRNYLFLRTLQFGCFDRDVKIIRLIYMYNTKIYRPHSNNWHIIIYAYVHKNAYIKHKTTQNKQFLFSLKGHH